MQYEKKTKHFSSDISLTEEQIVKIEHTWDYGQFENKENFILPSFDELKILILEYLDYLNDKIIKYKLDNMMIRTKENNLTSNSNSNYNNSCIYWIDTLLQMQLDDYRKRIVDLILVPYFVNIKHLSDDETIARINEWLAKCDKVKPLDSNVNFNYKIRYQINRCKSDRNLKPVRFEETLSKNNPNLYKIIKDKITLHSGVGLD